MSVVFLNRSRKMGAKSAIGPVTGLSYHIMPEGTPVSALDADGLLGLTEPPCCGETLPFGGEVRSFGAHIPSADQMRFVPEYLWNAQPLAAVEKPKREKLYKKYEKPEPIEDVPLVIELEEQPVIDKLDSEEE
jgi:hypothetical protein